MEKPTEKYSKYYYDKKRNMSDQDLGRYNARIPNYYKGKEGYEARKVCDNFELSYHCATATTYILRAYRKHDSPVECLSKAIAHLEFELDKIKREKK